MGILLRSIHVLELVCKVDYPEGMEAQIIDSIGQKCRSMEMNFLQTFIRRITDLILDGQDPNEMLGIILRAYASTFELLKTGIYNN